VLESCDSEHFGSDRCGALGRRVGGKEWEGGEGEKGGGKQFGEGGGVVSSNTEVGSKANPFRVQLPAHWIW